MSQMAELNSKITVKKTVGRKVTSDGLLTASLATKTFAGEEKQGTRTELKLP